MRRKTSNPQIRHVLSDRIWTSIPVVESDGLWDDGWVGGEARFLVRPPANATKLHFVGYKPDWLPSLLIFARADGVESRRQMLATGNFVVDVPFRQGQTEVEIRTRSEPVFVPSQLWESAEHRALSWVFVGFEVLSS